MNGLTFDEATHTYCHNGNVVPGVTTILAPLSNFDRVPPAVLSAASAFGTAVHMATELDDQGLLDESALDPALVPYLEAWRKFSQQLDVQWDAIEERVYHPTFRYAGTLDRRGYVGGVQTVLDIKSSAVLYPSVGPQLAAYQHACPTPSAQRMGLLLKPDGTYEAKTYTDPTDWPMFCSLMTVRTWCKKHSITPNFKD